MTPPPPGRDGYSAWPAHLAACIIAILGFLPLAGWLPDGRDVPWFAWAVSDWLSGGAIAVGTGAVLAILLKNRGDAFWSRIRPRLLPTAQSPGRVALLWTTATALLVYLLIAYFVFDGRPLIIDEIVEVLQARIFAAGRLWADTPQYPEFTTVLNVVNSGGRTFGHFPPGGPAALALGELLGGAWLAGPLFGAVSVGLMWWLVRGIEPIPDVRLIAQWLFALAPFTAFLAGSHMSHVPSLTFLLLGMAATVHALGSDKPRVGIAFVSGLGFGIAASVRPLDAFAFALPAGCWYLLRAISDRKRIVDLLVCGAGVAVPFCIFLAAQGAMTGSPFRFGYELLWGSNVGLGFHPSPWGELHTPVKGLELLNLYFLRLQSYLFESAGPALLPVVIALSVARRLSAADRYMLVSAAFLCGLYFGYWHDGFYLGPRFVYPLLPFLIYWTARLPVLIVQRYGVGFASRAAAYSLAMMFLMSLALGAPLRAALYRNAFTTMRWNADRAAEKAGVRGAVVLVRESWGAQIIARLWNLGVPNGAAEQLYQHVDACRLDQEVLQYENMAVERRPGGRQIAEEMRSLMADSARLIPSPLSPDTTELVMPGAIYPARCLRRIEEDRQGFTLLAPVLLARGGGNLYVRDLHERNQLILSQHPNRPVYLLRPRSTRVGEPPAFEPVSRDSILALSEQ